MGRVVNPWALLFSLSVMAGGPDAGPQICSCPCSAETNWHPGKPDLEIFARVSEGFGAFGPELLVIPKAPVPKLVLPRDDDRGLKGAPPIWLLVEVWISGHAPGDKPTGELLVLTARQGKRSQTQKAPLESEEDVERVPFMVRLDSRQPVELTAALGKRSRKRSLQIDCEGGCRL
jgi:hypothetical protein